MTERPRSFRVTAIVLRHLDWGEADRLLTLYTRETGKLRALGKGLRKLRSRKAGHLEPFTLVTAQLAQGSALPIVTQVETLNAHLPLRDSLPLTALSAYAIELVDRFTYEEEGAHPALFDLLEETLTRIEMLPDPWLALRFYELHLLQQVGFRPQLTNCARCARIIQPEEQFFSSRYGGTLCPRCGAAEPSARKISLNALKYLRHLQRSAYPQVQALVLEAQLRVEIENLLQAHIVALLERELNTPRFLQKLGPLNP